MTTVPEPVTRPDPVKAADLEVGQWIADDYFYGQTVKVLYVSPPFDGGPATLKPRSVLLVLDSGPTPFPIVGPADRPVRMATPEQLDEAKRLHRHAAIVARMSAILDVIAANPALPFHCPGVDAGMNFNREQLVQVAAMLDVEVRHVHGRMHRVLWPAGARHDELSLQWVGYFDPEPTPEAAPDQEKGKP